MADKTPITVDFETKGIGKRPYYPPKPVGMAVRWQDGTSHYYAWGHPDGNNCSVEKANRVLRDIHRSGMPVLYHNSNFDLDVGECHLGVAPPVNVEDTLYLAFLKNPFEETISLKPLGEKYLGMPPEERDEVKDWIIENIPAARKKQSEWGAYIGDAPPSIVGPYAVGDVERTYRIWEKFKPEVQARGMIPAYKRELALTPITLSMERTGVGVNVDGIKEAIRVFEKMDEDMMNLVRKKLNVKPSVNAKGKVKPFNVNSSDQLGEALMRAGKLDAIVKTPTGKISTTVANLRATCNDKELIDLLAVHSVVEKNLTSFLRPWLEQAEVSGGRILPSFHQVRARGDDGGNGARSGRYSSSEPNLQNVSANVEESKNRETLMIMQKWLKDTYKYEFIGMRDLIVPDEGTILCATDYNQQELRLLAHFERDVLMKAYLKNPTMDIHEFIRTLIKSITGLDFPRKHVKITVFGIVYGMGVGKLALQLGVSEELAKEVRNGIYKAVPGIKKLMDELKSMARRNIPVSTWGGREYFCEEPKFIEKYGKWMSFEYRQLNYLIQPSAADITKQGMLNVDDQVPEARIAIQVHDELVCMIPKMSTGKKVISAMCDVKMNIPMLAESKYSRTSWARAK